VLSVTLIIYFRLKRTSLSYKSITGFLLKLSPLAHLVKINDILYIYDWEDKKEVQISA